MKNDPRATFLCYSSIEKKSEKRKEREGNRTIVSLKRNAEKRATNKSIRRTEFFERSWPLNNENRTQQSPFIGNVAKKKPF